MMMENMILKKMIEFSVSNSSICAEVEIKIQAYADEIPDLIKHIERAIENGKVKVLF